MRPVTIVFKFIFSQSEIVDLPLDILRHRRIVGHVIQKPLLIKPVLTDDLLPPLITRFGIIVVPSNKIAAERPVVVGIGLPVRDGIELRKHIRPARSEDTPQQFVPRTVVSLRLRERQFIVWMSAHTQPETIGLQPLVSTAFLSGRLRTDLRQHSAGRVPRYAIWIDCLLEIMTMM